jgi:hypothetical protein
MTDFKRLASSGLLGLGVLLVFFGLTAALGFTPGGAIASLAVIGALVYSGAVWFAQPDPPDARASAVPRVAELTGPIVFDRDGRVVSGAGSGRALSAQFPETLRVEVNQRCAAALAGVAGRVAGDCDGRPVTFEFLPVRSSNGSVVYGLLVTSEAIAPPMAASA